MGVQGSRQTHSGGQAVALPILAEHRAWSPVGPKMNNTVTLQRPWRGSRRGGCAGRPPRGPLFPGRAPTWAAGLDGSRWDNPRPPPEELGIWRDAGGPREEGVQGAQVKGPPRLCLLPSTQTGTQTPRAPRSRSPGCRQQGQGLVSLREVMLQLSPDPSPCPSLWSLPWAAPKTPPAGLWKGRPIPPHPEGCPRGGLLPGSGMGHKCPGSHLHAHLAAVPAAGPAPGSPAEGNVLSPGPQGHAPVPWNVSLQSGLGILAPDRVQGAGGGAECPHGRAHHLGREQREGAEVRDPGGRVLQSWASGALASGRRCQPLGGSGAPVTGFTSSESTPYRISERERGPVPCIWRSSPWPLSPFTAVTSGAVVGVVVLLLGAGRFRASACTCDVCTAQDKLLSA